LIVIDCSAMVYALTDGGHTGTALRNRLDEAEWLAAPHLLDFEVASALFGLARGRRGGAPKLTAAGLERATDDYKAVPIRRYQGCPFWPRVGKLVANLSAYDAAYVALAESLGVPLVTSDVRIAKSGAARCRIETFSGSAEEK